VDNLDLEQGYPLAPSDDPASAEEYAFLHSTLCQIGLPRSRTAERVFERRNGKKSVLIKAGELADDEKWVLQPLPYGPKARLLFYDWFSYARRNRTPVIPLGRPTEYLRARLGLASQGSQFHAMYEQVRALVACELKVAYPLDGRIETVNMTPVVRSTSRIDHGQVRIWPEELEFTPAAYASAVEHSVPLDYAAIRRLGGTALGLDLYACWAERLRRIPREKPLFLSWTDLQSQFGQEYSNPRAFHQEFRARVEQVWHEAYPANVEFVPGGMKWRHTKPPVAPRGGR
jgi:hypothetical protein